MSIKMVMPSSHLILCHPLLLLLPIPPSIRVFPNESTLRMRWPKMKQMLNMAQALPSLFLACSPASLPLSLLSTLPFIQIPCSLCFCDRAFAHALLPDSSPTTEVLFRDLLRNCSKEVGGKVNLHVHILVRKYKLSIYFLVKDYCQSQRTDFSGTSLVVQQLGLHASTAGGTSLIPGRGTKILHAPRCGPKQTKTENKNNKKQRTVFSN